MAQREKNKMKTEERYRAIVHEVSQGSGTQSVMERMGHVGSESVGAVPVIVAVTTLGTK